MNKLNKIIVLFFFFVLIQLIFYAATRGNYMSPKKDRSELIIGFPTYWGSLIPPLQHTYYGDSLISNEFESLVALGTSGDIIPLAAINWEISDDFTSIIFEIDAKKQFSNGEHLKPIHFKNAWENGLKMLPVANNRSTLDVLYKTINFGNFEKTGRLEGVTVTETHLTIRFNSPFRMGLEFLAGSRYAAFIEVNGKYLGTGPYIIDEDKNTKTINLSRNPYSNVTDGFSSIKVIVVDQHSASEELENGKIDVLAFAGRSSVRVHCEENEISCSKGFEAAHVALSINGLPGTFFSNENYRKALQFLINEDIKKGGKLRDKLPSWFLNAFKFDSQVYLPLQPGRLEDNSVTNLISIGEKYVQEMIEASHKRPIKIVCDRGLILGSILKEFLQEKGVVFTDDSFVDLDIEEFRKISRNNSSDLTIIYFSVRNSDPDGLFHRLGRSGSIASPMELRPRTADLLEEGRKIFIRDELDAHYQKVSASVFEEVPFVHIGFTEDSTAYRKDRVAIKATGIRNRSREPFYFYEPL